MNRELIQMVLEIATYSERYRSIIGTNKLNSFFDIEPGRITFDKIQALHEAQRLWLLCHCYIKYASSERFREAYKYRIKVCLEIMDPNPHYQDVLEFIKANIDF